jgi:hypothetical protein
MHGSSACSLATARGARRASDAGDGHTLSRSGVQRQWDDHDAMPRPPACAVSTRANQAPGASRPTDHSPTVRPGQGRPEGGPMDATTSPARTPRRKSVEMPSSAMAAIRPHHNTRLPSSTARVPSRPCRQPWLRPGACPTRHTCRRAGSSSRRRRVGRQAEVGHRSRTSAIVALVVTYLPRRPSRRVGWRHWSSGSPGSGVVDTSSPWASPGLPGLAVYALAGPLWSRMAASLRRPRRLGEGMS